MADLTTLGPYQIIERVRQGRSADTYLAEHSRMRTRRVLLRVLHDEAAADAAFLNEFVGEARKAAKLQHDCIASVIDLETENRPLYTVLEFVEGMDPGEMLKAFGTLPVEIAAAILAEVCRGLEYAHENGMLHGRLRPRQIKITPDGRVKILGFGSKEQTSVISPTVMISDVAREELYRPPEQVREEPEGPTSDLFSCGVIVFELLTGRLPFATLARYGGGTTAERAVPRVRDANPLVPPAIATLVERLLGDEPVDRPQSAVEVRREIESVLESRGDVVGPDLMRAYLAQPSEYAARSKRRVADELVKQAEGLARGPQAAKVTAIRELDTILGVMPDHSAARALARRLRAGQPPPRPDDDPFATRVMAPQASDTTATQVMTPRAGGLPPRPGPVPPPRPRGDEAGALPPPPRDDRPRRRMAPVAGVVALVLVAAAAIAASLTLGRGCSRETGGGETAAGAAVPVPAAGAVAVRPVPGDATVKLLATGEVRVGEAVFGNVVGGTCRLHVEKDGYAPRDTSIAVAAGETTRVVVSLARGGAPVAAPLAAASCSLYVRTNRPATRVTLDGFAIAGGPNVFATTTAPGAHRLLVEADGFATWTGKVSVPTTPVPRVIRNVELLEKAASAPAPVAATAPAATPAPAAAPAPAPVGGGVPMDVDVSPASDVLVDGAVVARGVTHATVSLAPGSHTVTLAHPDYARASRSFNVKPNANLKPWKVDLAAGVGWVRVSGPRSGLRIYVDGKDSGSTTPAAVKVPAGTHSVSVHDWTTRAQLAEKRVVVDPNKHDSIPIEF